MADDDPLLPSNVDALAMTHQAEAPNPAAPWIQRAQQFKHGGLAEVFGWPENMLSRNLRSPALADALQFWTPLVEVMKLSPGSLSGLTRAMQVPSRFVAPQARRLAVLDKLIANEDFNPIMHEGKMHFASLDAAENEEINRIGWSRAPDVTSEMETGPEKQAAWRQNIAYWRQLAEPAGQ